MDAVKKAREERPNNLISIPAVTRLPSKRRCLAAVLNLKPLQKLQATLLKRSTSLAIILNVS
jgi:hypothetical protein